jgi:hypothetical protein
MLAISTEILAKYCNSSQRHALNKLELLFNGES